MSCDWMNVRVLYLNEIEISNVVALKNEGEEVMGIFWHIRVIVDRIHFRVIMVFKRKCSDCNPRRKFRKAFLIYSIFNTSSVWLRLFVSVMYLAKTNIIINKPRAY